MSKGKYLERLIAIVEETLKPYDHFKVKHDVLITDKNGTKRQIDVLIETKGDVRFDDFRIIVEAKNWNERVDLNTVGAFMDLLESTKVTRGIIVTKKGFQSGAITKATSETSKKILLYQIEETTDEEIERWIAQDIHEIRLSPSNEYEISHFDFLFSTPSEHLPQNELLTNGVIRYTSPERKFRFLDFVSYEQARILPSAMKDVTIKLLERYEIENLPSSVFTDLQLVFPDNTFLQVRDKEATIKEVRYRLVFDVSVVTSQDTYKEIYRELEGEERAEIITADFGDYNYVLVRSKVGDTERYFMMPKSVTGDAKTEELFNLGKVKKEDGT